MSDLELAVMPWHAYMVPINSIYRNVLTNKLGGDRCLRFMLNAWDLKAVEIHQIHQINHIHLVY
jgi:hypothetical protein